MKSAVVKIIVIDIRFKPAFCGIFQLMSKSHELRGGQFQAIKLVNVLNRYQHVF